MSKYRIFYGNSNIDLASKIVKQLSGIEGKKHELGQIDLKKFKDGEFWCQIKESVRGQDVFILQSTCTPVNENLMELFIITDALRRASAKKITAIIPYFGYARQDRKTRPRVPITSALVSKLISASGVDRVVSVDLHCGQIQGFFDNRIPVDNLYSRTVLAQGFIKYVNELKKDSVTVVSPDAGGAKRTEDFQNYLNTKFGFSAKMALMSKKRESANKVSKIELIGGSAIKGKDCIIVDDIADTCGTLCACAKVLKDNGAKRVFACVSHGLLNGDAQEKLENSVIDKLFITDTIPLRIKCKKVVVCSVSKLLAETIQRIHNNESISSLFT